MPGRLQGNRESSRGTVDRAGGGPERAAKLSFTLLAASREESVRRAGPEQHGREQPAENRPCVLVVDLDRGTRMNVQNTLDEAGFNSVAAANLNEAERIVESEHPPRDHSSRAAQEAEGAAAGEPQPGRRGIAAKRLTGFQTATAWSLHQEGTKLGPRSSHR